MIDTYIIGRLYKSPKPPRLVRNKNMFDSNICHVNDNKPRKKMDFFGFEPRADSHHLNNAIFMLDLPSDFHFKCVTYFTLHL
jgi:hypothetical protein